MPSQPHPHFVLAWHGAGKGADRFYAWPDALFRLKRKALCPFLSYPNSLYTSDICLLITSLQ
ncbi:hypothetical protein EXW39_01865 [Bacillus mycoides]|nr:hypothetical protein CN600_12465 [Bacillus mycoides]QBP93085.1 hypothetical protein E1A90_19540 [Bacillus mycoides]QWG86597.1 hypothetical protein EXW61_25280 [Bacillus mycoides]QWH63772.1 hypothetical protein EXW39_01865 [Bacillus mycoides]